MDGTTESDSNPQGQSTSSEETPDDVLPLMSRRVMELDGKIKSLQSEIEKMEKLKSDARELLFVIEREEGQRQINLETFGMQIEPIGEFWVCDVCKRHLASPYKPKFCPFCETLYSVNKMQIRGASNEAQLKTKLGFDSE